MFRSMYWLDTAGYYISLSRKVLGYHSRKYHLLSLFSPTEDCVAEAKYEAQIAQSVVSVGMTGNVKVPGMTGDVGWDSKLKKYSVPAD
jgi:hypothetical protein